MMMKKMNYDTMNVKPKLKVSLSVFFSKKFLVFVSLLFMVVLVFSPLVSVYSELSFFAAGAGTPDKVVKNETELINAINAATSDKTPYSIGLNTDITLKNSLEIPSDKSITLVSVDGVWRLYGTDKQYTITVTGLLTIDGICITHKNGNAGGGVVVKAGGALTLLSGKISDNIRATDGSNRGGGVFVDSGGSFVMSGGTISGNTAQSMGGGVCNRGTFTLTGGEISGNTAVSEAGGVYVGGFGCSFVMSGGKISNNKAPIAGGVLNDGGGVLHGGVTTGVTFTMTGGEITGNTAETYCGGVLSADETFDWRGGVISGNTAGIAHNDVGDWAIVSGTPVHSSNENNDEGAEENNESNSDGDFDVGSNGGSEAGELGLTGKLLDGLFLPVVVIVGVVAVGFGVAVLFFYHSKSRKRVIV